MRADFRFDWNGDGYVSPDVISWVSWGGHCNDKSNLESMGMVLPTNHAGIQHYDARSGESTHVKRKAFNEDLLSISEMGSVVKDLRTGRAFDQLCSHSQTIVCVADAALHDALCPQLFGDFRYRARRFFILLDAGARDHANGG